MEFVTHTANDARIVGRSGSFASNDGNGATKRNKQGGRAQSCVKLARLVLFV
jgi:hypothetical protein